MTLDQSCLPDIIQAIRREVLLPSQSALVAYILPRESQMEEVRLPAEILTKGSLRGGEYAWRVDDIPLVIDAAREAGLVSIGGQLQFRGPEFTCECYWVEVDTYKAVPSDLPSRFVLIARLKQRAEHSRSSAVKSISLQRVAMHFPTSSAAMMMRLCAS
jgi:hypothetical protein